MHTTVTTATTTMAHALMVMMMMLVISEQHRPPTHEYILNNVNTLHLNKTKIENKNFNETHDMS